MKYRVEVTEPAEHDADEVYENGTYQGRQRGATKAQPECATELQQRRLGPAEIANALHVSEHGFSLS